MTISDYLQKSSAYTVDNWLAETESLIKTSSAAGNFPYTQPIPLPENTNLITGFHRYDINAQRLDLHAASAGVDRTLWLFAADAEILNLRVREGQNPLMVFSNISGPGTDTRLEAHHAYFLDQFTPESISRLYEYASPESIQDTDMANSRRRYMFAKMAVLTIANYDSGIRDQYTRRSIVKNIRENSNPQSASFEDSTNAYRYYVRKNRNTAGIFNILRKYYICQVSGSPLNSSNKEPVPGLSGFLSNIPAAIKSMFNARIFVKRLENQNFFLDYSHSTPPKASFIQTEPELRPSSPSPYQERTRR
jgi:hypothetical protein